MENNEIGLLESEIDDLKSKQNYTDALDKLEKLIYLKSEIYGKKSSEVN